jgi:hypothetical protein
MHHTALFHRTGKATQILVARQIFANLVNPDATRICEAPRIFKVGTSEFLSCSACDLNDACAH